MTYFGIDSERYGGYDKGEELENAELPPDREVREEIEREREAFEEAMKLDTTGVYQDVTGNDGDD